jgi:oxygen-independent coproporphyrinogen-3 oxidase
MVYIKSVKVDLNKPEKIALYIHIPFCWQKCGYCSFVSYAGQEGLIPQYIQALKDEMKLRSRHEPVGTVYFGGGTPSLLTVRQAGELLDTMKRAFNISAVQEVSLEANPGTVSLAYLRELLGMGINRISLGVQNFNDGELQCLGRIHTAAEATQAFRLAGRAGFNNINLDLIYGIPGQGLGSWRSNLQKALELSPQHISLYSLTLEEGTPMSAQVGKGDLELPSNNALAEQYELAEELLGNSGYQHYEISNWALPDYECRHNLTYWQYQPYLGLGLAAHSFLQSRRQANTSNLEKYLLSIEQGQVPLEMDEHIDVEMQLSEAMILGLRLTRGLQLERITADYNINPLEKFAAPIAEMQQAGLLILEDGYLRLTPRGRLLGNEVFFRLLPDR